MNNIVICPKCNTNLAVSLTHGIEIDYCPNCRGVWLDKGELEKIIERSYSSDSSYMGGNEYSNYHEDHREKNHDYDHNPRRKKGFFSELFDF